jgi:hypothetical protein
MWKATPRGTHETDETMYRYLAIGRVWPWRYDSVLLAPTLSSANTASANNRARRAIKSIRRYGPVGGMPV